MKHANKPERGSSAAFATASAGPSSLRIGIWEEGEATSHPSHHRRVRLRGSDSIEMNNKERFGGSAPPRGLIRSCL